MITLFGPGVLYGTPIGGGTPCNFGKVKEVSIDIDATTKALTGQFQAPLDFGRGELKITGKAKMAAISSSAIAQLFWGVTPATGSTLTQFLEAGAFGAETATYTVANSATFLAVQEILYAATGQPLQQVGSAPAAGQYTIAAGVITGNTADKGAGILVSYTYSSTGGFNLNIVNQLQGTTPKFSAVVYNTKNGMPVTYTVPFCVSSKLSRGAKENDFVNPEIDFMVGANAAGQIIVENYPELS